MKYVQGLRLSVLLSLVAGLIMLMGLPFHGASAMAALDDVAMEGGRSLSNGEMDELRAGFMDPSGHLFRFAIDVHSMVDGTLMFVRSLVLQVGRHGQFEATASNQVLPQNLPAGMTANVVDNGAGVVVSDKNGNSTLLNQTANGALASVILNTANNRNLSQTMDINIVLQHVQGAMGTTLSAAHRMPFNNLGNVGQMHRLGFGL